MGTFDNMTNRKTYKQKLDEIRAKVPEDELYSQLAEDAMRLAAQAMMAARRFRGNRNPVTKSRPHVRQMVAEALTDLEISRNALELEPIPSSEVLWLDRWYRRVKDKREVDGDE